MSLRHAILALLTVEPMTGYDLLKQFEASVGHVWHAPDSQIYPALRAMEKDGLLEGADVTWGQRGTKRRYTITESGRAEFRAWMDTPLAYPRDRDPVHLKAAYLEWATPDAARAQLRAHIAHYQERLEQWREKIREIETGGSSMLNRRLATVPEHEHPRTIAFKRYTYEGMIARAEAEIAWAERGLALLDELE
ncbi:PadR family transcriptional regulator [Salinibacterium sp. SYSU T00001]|uniref:PadR family transcriptional regulator n=1 Tax=Homoserinimonas sedimenticola TaxID=2986805 RepID=UPI0022359CFA|nr:PadR family transcriptional regulator [Salinibacterium sedimenticola]MCW4385973.1 PadR family transcriptional regulator [Salinibacterium sedimenticola]